MSAEIDRLALKATALSHVNKQAWDEFLDALEGYSRIVIMDCIKSPLDQLPVAQGRAQQMSQLLDKLRNAPAVAQKLVKP